MSKSELCITLYSDMVSRFSTERPGLVIGGLFAERLYLSIVSILEKDGEMAARRYVREARLL